MANCCVEPRLVAVQRDVVDIGVSGAECGLLEEAGGIAAGSTTGAGGVPLTTPMRSAEVAGPGAGLRTWISRLPGWVRLTLAVSCVPLLKVVATGEPFCRTCAPLMNCWPVTTDGGGARD